MNYLNVNEIKNHFVKVPHALLQDNRLKPTQKLVLIYIMERAWDTTRTWPTRDEIATHCGISLKTVSNCTKFLSENSYIEIRNKEDKPGRNNVYHIIDRYSWKDICWKKSQVKRVKEEIDTLNEKKQNIQM